MSLWFMGAGIAQITFSNMNVLRFVNFIPVRRQASSS
jgi:hypothetical protein